MLPVQEAVGIRHHHERERRKLTSLPQSHDFTHHTKCLQLSLAGRRGRFTTNRTLWGGGDQPGLSEQFALSIPAHHAGGMLLHAATAAVVACLVHVGRRDWK